MLELKLIDAINDFDEYDDTSFINLRDLICEISDNTAYDDDTYVRRLLYIASQKMRRFGYNHMNKLVTSSQLDDTSLIANTLIDSYYRSESGYLLDIEQKNALDSYDNNKPQRRLFLSAPTAFGKTFILKEIILKYDYNLVLLIFPTVSLLNENVDSIKSFIEQNQLDYKIINSVRELEGDLARKILILTPERVLSLLATHPNIIIDFFFMDEVYKVDNFFDSTEENTTENERDTVFRIVLYKLSKLVNDFYLAGPYINTDFMGLGFNRYLEASKVAIYKVDRELISKQYINAWTTKMVVNETGYKLPKGKYEKLKSILDMIDDQSLGKTLVYMATKNQVDKASRYIVNNQEDEVIKKSTDRSSFINHLRRRYSFLDGDINTSDNWSLIRMLKLGYGTHHGSLPKYIQAEMLELFNKGDLDVILSTTSITEGVNTDAKNVVFYGGRKGDKQLKVFDIKNINGRAGRYYMNFIGRIFYMVKEVKEKLDEQRDEALDFATYGDDLLGGVDIDNAEKSDLSERNALIKEQREIEIKLSGIPEDIFIKNRLVDKLKQIEMVQALDALSTNELRQQALSYSSLRTFLVNGELFNILTFLNKLGIIEDYEVKVFSAITSSYTKGGFAKLLSYEIKKTKENSGKLVLSDEEYDGCYRKVFSKIRNDVEFKVPKYIHIYSCMFAYICSKRSIELSESAFEAVIAFYELGVKSEVGIFLAERGFPILTIIEMEVANPKIMINVEKFRTIINGSSFPFSSLDAYEIKLLNKYMAI